MFASTTQIIKKETQLGLDMGILWVQILDTTPVPSVPAPVQVTGIHHTQTMVGYGGRLQVHGTCSLLGLHIPHVGQTHIN